MVFLEGARVLVTGGASFIGSHLVEALVERGARVRVADDLSSGSLDNLVAVRDRIELREGDLKRWEFALESSRGCDTLFHLAADHGGRGYIASHPASCATNLALDGIVFETAVRSGVSRIVFASSACVYPTDVQRARTPLSEDMVSFSARGGAFAEEEYGWAKLMGEMSLRAYHRQHGIRAASARLFSAYGPRENESHAIIALIARAMLRQSPFEIWGDGEQTRNFTYVDDVVEGLLLAAEHIEDGSAVNVGTSEFISLNRAAEAVFSARGWRPPGGIRYRPDRPVGVRHRAADGTRARERMGWRPRTHFEEGLKKTVAWYRQERWCDEIRDRLESLLCARSG